LNELLIGTLLALGALTFVLYPLFISGPPAAPPSVERDEKLVEPARNPALDALREIEFDRETGKLSDADYSVLKETYTQRAVTAMRAGGGPVCEMCGPRPERDAVFCSNCGMLLPPVHREPQLAE
jgi:hypothetical protein